MKKALFILCFTFLLAPLSAKEPQKVEISINGMVCAFCAQGIEGALLELPGVKKVDVDLDSKIVTLIVEPGKKVEDAALKKSITDSGYNVVSIARK